MFKAFAPLDATRAQPHFFGKVPVRLRERSPREKLKGVPSSPDLRGGPFPLKVNRFRDFAAEDGHIAE